MDTLTAGPTAFASTSSVLNKVHLRLHGWAPQAFYIPQINISYTQLVTENIMTLIGTEANAQGISVSDYLNTEASKNYRARYTLRVVEETTTIPHITHVYIHGDDKWIEQTTEVFPWLGSALRKLSIECMVKCVVPIITKHNKGHNAEDAVYDVHYSIDNPASTTPLTLTSWAAMFCNAAIASCSPARAKPPGVTGLEIDLPAMAGMSGGRVITVFGMYLVFRGLPGFRATFVLKEVIEGVCIWIRFPWAYGERKEILNTRAREMGRWSCKGLGILG
ncbi:hypothetical protein GQ44DRAFT_827382 [Phaeosphaeriaceae sp. PMI808]|nr:hypothetical protein GQ44DRAFT_827382 [Phaeosphaeriaceae sp. PMI808]